MVALHVTYFVLWVFLLKSICSIIWDVVVVLLSMTCQVFFPSVCWTLHVHLPVLV